MRIGVSQNPVAQGVSVMLTATVSGLPGTGTPTGTMTFTSGSTVLGTVPLDWTGAASMTTTSLPVGMDPITMSYSGDAVYLPVADMVTETVTNAVVTGLTVTAPTGSGSANSGSASMPKLAPGASLTLTVTGSYTNGMMGSVSGVTYVSSDPMKVTVDATGKVTGIAPGSVTITITTPNGVMTTLTVTVASVSTGGLTNPQSMTHSTVAPASATPREQPGVHPTGGSSSGVQPQATGAPTATPIATPNAQPGRH